MIMCFRSLKQLYLLLWKNFTLHRRKWSVTLLEIFIPAIFALLFVYIRQRVNGTVYDKPTIWRPFSINKIPPKIAEYDLLSYTPDIPITQRLMNKVKESNIGIKGILGFETEEAMISFLGESFNKTAKKMLGGIVFSSFNVSEPHKMPGNVTYKIRLPYASHSGIRKHGFSLSHHERSWMTAYTYPVVSEGGPRHEGDPTGGAPGYFIEGFLALQHHIDRAILNVVIPPSVAGGLFEKVNVKLQRFPYPPYLDDPFVNVIQQYMPVVILLAYIFTALNVVSSVVHEKEMRLKESMKLMGLQSWLHWTAWFIDFFVILTLSVTILIACFFIKFGDHGRVFTYSESSVIFVFLTLYTSTIIIFCFAISTFFDSARCGAAATFLIFFLTYMPYLFLQPRYHTLTLSGKLVTCLLPNVAMSFGCQLIGMFEGTESGVQWSNVAQGISVDDSFTMLHVLGMFVLDCVIYMTIAWYKETVSPGEFGTPQPWYFPLTRSYWFGPLHDAALDPSSVGAPADAASAATEERTPLLRKERRTSTAASVGTYTSNLEPDPSGLPCSVKLENLTKTFGRGCRAKIAVNNLNLRFYEGQITALLGHNGAGKTTTMSMITGFIPSTSGTVTINGMDIRRDFNAVRRLLGLCPQHDVLFGKLTVEEHLRFFAKLKDCHPEFVESEVFRMLAATKLEAKRFALAETLSGGMKRKLSVAIALIGGSRIVVLDEPTSGMDPAARRELWTFLQAERANRTMLLSTHFMEEADLLGDRIAIMSGGVLQCSGSSLFLKSRYGAGYHLTMVKSPSCNVKAVMDLVISMVPEARPESHVSDELSLILPTEASHCFEALFNEIEERKGELGILSYGASMTTMEEVFFKVGDNQEIDPPVDPPRSYGSSRSSSVSSINLGPTSTSSMNDLETISEARSAYEEEHNQSFFLLWQQFSAIVLKRMILSCRSYFISTAQLLVPVLFTCVGLIVLKTWPGPSDSPPLALTLDKFGPQVITFGNPFNSSKYDLMTAYQLQFNTRPQTNVRYLNFLPNYKTEGYLNVLERIAQNDISLFNKEYVIGAHFSEINDSTDPRMDVIALFNNQPYHSPAITLNAISNAVLRAAQMTGYNITVVNHPQPLTSTDRSDQMLLDYSTAFTVAFNVVFGMAFLAASFTVTIIRERSTKVKHLHYVSGINKFIYWVATFAWDYINYFIPCVLTVIVFLSFNENAYSGSTERVIGVFCFLALYGWSAIPLMYLCSYIFKSPSSGLVWMTVVNVITGVLPLLLVTIFETLNRPGFKETAAHLKWIFLVVSPNYNLGQGLYDLYTNNFYKQTCTLPLIVKLCAFGAPMPCCPKTCGRDCVVWNPDFLGWAPRGIGRMFAFLCLQGIVFFAICLTTETSFFARFTNLLNPERIRALQLIQHQHEGEGERAESLVEEDTDVAEMRRLVLRTPRDALLRRYSVVLHEMTRFYGQHCAVDRLSCVVSRGECFGLLGINGAGKTSTFKMLTGDLGITAGDAFIDGYSVRQSLRQVQRKLGYCPQFDALLERLTGRETLTLFARLRGLRDDLIAAEVEALASTLLLIPFMDKLVGGLSGGNKRKLSTAVALVGGHSVVCLDEPTSGMDPNARRHVWRALTHYRDHGRTLILTSHSMEECEALCTKIAIMVNGQFKCFGSGQHLKAKFGRGYTLMAKVMDGEDEVESERLIRRFMSFIKQKLPSAELKDIHQGLVHFHLHPHPSISWATVFALMESQREELCLEDYSVSQTSLEQVFLSFARAQEPPTMEEKRSCFGAMRRMCRCCRRPSVELRPLDHDLSINA